MGFRFRFETLLRQKHRAVDEIASRHAQALRLVQQEQENLATLEEAHAAHGRRYTTVLVHGLLDAANLQTSVQYAAFLTQAMGEQHTRVEEMQARVTQIRDMLVEAEREKQVLENLKERQRERHVADRTARERAEFDGIANTLYTAKHQAAALARGA